MSSVKVTVAPGAIFVDPWVPSLARALTYTKKVKEDKWPFKMMSEKKYMYTTSKDPYGKVVGLTYEGLWWEVLQHLQKCKIDVEWEDTRPRNELVPVMENLMELRPLQDRALDVFLNYPLGVIECPPGFGKTFLFTQLPRLYPDANIVVVTPRADVVQDIYRRTKEMTLQPKEVRLCRGGRNFPKTGKVVVMTAGSLHKIPPSWPDILVFDEVHGCATPRQVTSLERFSCRRYGLSASPSGRLDGADLEVVGMFGPTQCQVTYPEAEAAGLVCPIKVHMIPVKPAELVDAKSDIDKQRFGYWQNHTRNQMIAWAARQHGPEEVTLILVKTLEHALFLRLLLPEFFIVHGGVASDEEGNAKWQKFCDLGLVQDTPDFTRNIRNVDSNQLKEMFADGRVKKVISTPKWREGVDFKSLEVLIRGDGSSGSIDSIQIVGRLSRIYPGKDFGTLYDFIDLYGPSYENKSLGRMRHYEKQGWSIQHYRTP